MSGQFSQLLPSHPPLAARALGGLALFATANTALITLLAASRMLYGMASEGDLPRALSRGVRYRGRRTNAAGRRKHS